MEIHVHNRDVSFDEGRVEAEVEHAVGRFADRLTRVDVFLRDLNADKGGIDKRCVLEARPRGLDPVAAEFEAAGAVDALVGAAGKLERLLAHRFGKLEDRR